MLSQSVLPCTVRYICSHRRTSPLIVELTLFSGLDIPTVMGEVARCLKPGGTFAAFSYAVTGTSGSAEIDKILGEAEGAALRRVLPPPETSWLTRNFLETTTSHYDNIAVPPSLYTYETRVHWNKDSNVFYMPSHPAAVDRRNLASDGYQEVSRESKQYVRPSLAARREEN